MTPNLAQPYVFGPLPPGVGGGAYIFIFPNLAPGPGTWPTLDQGRGPHWTRVKAHTELGTWPTLTLEQEWARFGPGMGPR